MDLEPFGRINPCGLLGVSVTRMADLAQDVSVPAVRERLVGALADVYGLSPRTSGRTGCG
jgi:lipoate-protein ligase B